MRLELARALFEVLMAKTVGTSFIDRVGLYKRLFRAEAVLSVPRLCRGLCELWDSTPMALSAEV